MCVFVSFTVKTVHFEPVSDLATMKGEFNSSAWLGELIVSDNSGKMQFLSLRG